MTPEQIAYAALASSILSILFSAVVSTPKETRARVGNLEVNHAETKRDLANLIKTVDKLAELVYAKETHHGRANR